VSSENQAITRTDICAVAVAECFRGDGEIMVSPMSPTSKLGAMLARATFEPDLVMTDGVNMILADNVPLGADLADAVIEGWMPFPFVFDTLFWGKRHVMMGGSQIDQYGNQNLAYLGGTFKQPKTQLLGVRGAPGNTINHTTSYFIGDHNPRVLVPKVDCVAGVGYDRAAKLHPNSRARHEIRRVITNLCVLDFETPDNRMRLRSVHPGVSVADVQAATGFELVIPSDVPESREPTADELAWLRKLDPKGVAAREVKS
jgi:acyl CoA:acetate/3-ketoacid CoA transferase beta subunit